MEDKKHYECWADYQAETEEELVLSFLENEVRTMPKLRILEIVSVENRDVSFAEPTIAFTKERHTRQIREPMAQEAKKQLADSAGSKSAPCEFCGEMEHIWVNCFNLCNFCRAFGHFRKNCPALPSSPSS